MCVFILKGTRPDTSVEIKYDEFSKQLGDINDVNFIKNNSGKNNMFPGGPTCNFCGQDVRTWFYFLVTEKFNDL